MLISSPHQLQLENAHLNAEVKKLKVRGTSGQAVPDNAMAAVSATTSSTISGTTTTNQDTSLHCDYSSFRKCFAVLSELWVQRSISRQPNPLHFQSSGPWDPEWCQSDAAWNEGIIVELYSLIWEHYHEHIEHSPVFSNKVRRQPLQVSPWSQHPQFMMGVKQMQTYLIDNVWKSAADIFSINSITDSKCCSASYDRATVPAITSLLKNPKTPDE